jgi:hypothetical protein
MEELSLFVESLYWNGESLPRPEERLCKRVEALRWTEGRLPNPREPLYPLLEPLRQTAEPLSLKGASFPDIPLPPFGFPMSFFFPGSAGILPASTCSVVCKAPSEAPQALKDSFQKRADLLKERPDFFQRWAWVTVSGSTRTFSKGDMVCRC